MNRGLDHIGPAYNILNQGLVEQGMFGIFGICGHVVLNDLPVCGH